MDDFRELYQRIEYLRNNGVKMKEIADCAEMAPSILSSLYTTVLPAYFEGLKNFRRKKHWNVRLFWLTISPNADCFPSCRIYWNS